MNYDYSKLKYADSVIPSMSIQEAQELQFKLVDCISSHFTGDQFLSLGDLGVVPDIQRPSQTKRVEETLARFFSTESAALVRGAGTGAIRIILSALLEPGEEMFIHTAPVYSTTVDIFRLLGVKTNSVDYNNLSDVELALKTDHACKVFYIQHSRQKPSDTYDLKVLIQFVKTVRPDIKIVCDDNYCALKTYGIAVEYGADYSTFSGFKVLGPEGVGVIVGKSEAISVVQQRNYSGGGQVQGFEAMELLRMMTFAPVLLAIQNEQVKEICQRLNEGEIPQVASAYMVNAQSKVVIVELAEPIAEKVIQNSNAMGAATHPVGAESKYEILPMFYRVSGTFLAADPSLKKYGIRINPMKSGASTVLRILEKAIIQIK